MAKKFLTIVLEALINQLELQYQRPQRDMNVDINWRSPSKCHLGYKILDPFLPMKVADV